MALIKEIFLITVTSLVDVHDPSLTYPPNHCVITDKKIKIVVLCLVSRVVLLWSAVRLVACYL